MREGRKEVKEFKKINKVKERTARQDGREGGIDGKKICTEKRDGKKWKEGRNTQQSSSSSSPI